ncbi:MAG: DUF1257 domain-containing protein [Lentisphaerae bacterium]|nr:DUF1257 domain-containing protein [Lentisphaerota bacterium]MBT7055034.1 DUF1257 domain-containing protein [Lentisphaerota bacterium]
MSHFTEIRTQVRDIEALRDACAEMGIELLNNAVARGYGSNRLEREHVIRLRGPYDIALNRNGDGHFTLTTDWWNGHVEKEVGKDFGRLLQMYGVHKATREARRRGHAVRRKQLKDGSIRLSIGAA